MDLQVRELDLARGNVVVDLGSGTGDFLRTLRSGSAPSDLTVIEVDMIREALDRSAVRDRGGANARVAALRITADLDCPESLPLAASSVDAALLSLVIGYVSDPAALLQRVRSVLRVGGRLVVSSMRRDADISRIYREGVEELQPDRVVEHFGDRARSDFQRLRESS